MTKKEAELENGICIPVKIGTQDWWITSDKFNYVLGKKKDSVKNGKPQTTYTGSASYYSNLSDLMCGLQEFKLKAMDATTLLELQNNIIESKKMVAGIYGKMTKEELE